MLRRYAPRAVAQEEIVRELRATPFLVRRIVDQLLAESLVVVEGQDAVRFQPSSTEQERLCEMLDTASRERPIALRDAITSSPDSKLRNFADAFRFKDKDR